MKKHGCANRGRARLRGVMLLSLGVIHHEIDGQHGVLLIKIVLPLNFVPLDFEVDWHDPILLRAPEGCGNVTTRTAALASWWQAICAMGISERHCPPPSGAPSDLSEFANIPEVTGCSVTFLDHAKGSNCALVKFWERCITNHFLCTEIVRPYFNCAASGRPPKSDSWHVVWSIARPRWEGPTARILCVISRWWPCSQPPQSPIGDSTTQNSELKLLVPWCLSCSNCKAAFIPNAHACSCIGTIGHGARCKHPPGIERHHLALASW